MIKHRSQPMTQKALPPLYATVIPGLESIAAEELGDELGAEIKRTAPGMVVFRLDEVDSSVLRLRTTEDIFLLAWGTDQLTYRAQDLRSIEHWTAKDAKWQQLLQIHHAVRPKPSGKPTYRLVTQMTGRHGYRRVDAGKALAKGLAGKLPASWKPAEENAAVEIWLTIQGKTAVCGLRLSDRTMRHRKYKLEHIPASLRPTMAAAMVRLAGARPDNLILDPMCGAGTILAEQLAVFPRSERQRIHILGGDIDREALRNTRANLHNFPPLPLLQWDATHLPLSDGLVSHILSNPPFGKQIATPEEIGPLYRQAVREMDRVLQPGGKAVLLVSDFAALKQAADNRGWKQQRRLDVRVLGQKAVLSVWRKPGA
jgi:23S rRNA G2445 N2-methylase RlmL